MKVINFILSGSGLGALVCRFYGHQEGMIENRWPSLGADGLIQQCPRCLSIKRACVGQLTKLRESGL